MAGNQRTLVVGGGFFGAYIAEFLARMGAYVMLVERSKILLGEASLINQARVHNGYHYPRSLLTGLRSRLSMPVFVSEFPDCIVDEFESYYAVGNVMSHVSDRQFLKFCQRIGAPCEVAPTYVTKHFNSELISAVFQTVEYAFDAVKLRDRMMTRLSDAGVDLALETEVLSISRRDAGAISAVLRLPDGTCESFSFDNIFNCTYASLNETNAASALPIIPLRHEMTEMILVDVPPPFDKWGVTVMCGPFFSIMPYPSTSHHSMSHVRYTPHYTWTDSLSFYDPMIRKNAIKHPPPSNWRKMRNDVVRYAPGLAEMQMRRSIWAVKSILPRSDSDDSRPILFAANHGGVQGYNCVLGGKIDNVYDVIQSIQSLGISVV